MAIAGIVIGVLGIIGGGTLFYFGASTWRWLYTHLGRRQSVKKSVEKVALANSHPYSRREAGTYRSVKITAFVDLLSAMCGPRDRHDLDRWLLRWIGLEKLKFDQLAVPKLGNVMLGYSLAQKLRKPLVVVYQKVGTGITTREFDGYIQPGSRVVIVDDVASDPEFLLDVVKTLRKHDAVIVALVVAVNRVEGSTSVEMQREGVRYLPVITLQDDEIQRSFAAVAPSAELA